MTAPLDDLRDLAVKMAADNPWTCLHVGRGRCLCRCHQRAEWSTLRVLVDLWDRGLLRLPVGAS